jgi:TetR/AcrR family transcriptional regulator
MPRPRRPRAAADSRRALFAAAAAEFAARGYAGANVDRIARAARLNKAMIYYHFRSKAALYREILRDMFQAVGSRVAAIAASDASPVDKITAYIEAIAAEGQARPHFPPMWLREIAEGGEHLDAGTARYIGAVLGSLRAIIDEGAKAGRFQRVDPMVVQAGVIAPLMFFLATRTVRNRLERAGVSGVARVTRDDIVAHIQRVTLAVLEGRIA